jgi:hypothetical protein
MRIPSGGAPNDSSAAAKASQESPEAPAPYTVPASQIHLHAEIEIQASPERSECLPLVQETPTTQPSVGSEEFQQTRLVV